ncbi:MULTISPECIES: ATP-binding protein [unclassified Aureimonas]|uniref:ATP-binding protein n=1 Tax=unclassified Aureimonas TaxID=2615206 RepID=UPI000721141A|nr:MULTISPECIES: ATP-binding protein [unclassified Aureimonas]ALN75663.1 hypothetical protein M673_23240 [Aureimonas sp. AU20]
MTPALAGGRASVRRSTRATWLSLASSVLLLALLVAAYVNLANRSSGLQDGIREDALWAVYQIGHESSALSSTLRDTLADGMIDDAEAKVLGLRYDILYSRMTVLDGSRYGAYFSDENDIRSKRVHARQLIASLQPTFDALDAGARYVDALRAALRDVRELEVTAEDLLLLTNTAVSAARADARAELLRLQDVAAWIVLALFVSVGLLVLSLCRRLQATRAIGQQIQAVADEMKGAFAAAEAGNRAKSEFMATMSHEIRTPLNAILGMSELLSMSKLSADDRESVAAIGSSGTALLEVINEILDFTKIEHGNLLSECIPFDPVELVREANIVVNVRALERGNSILFEGTSVTGFYEGDPTRLRRVLINLLSNATKFTENGCIRVSLRETGTPDAPRLRFDVSDNGIGIAPEARPLLFRPFSQVDGSISRRFGGTGLGLAICKRIVEAADGEIGVESAAGVGSRFWFEVPAHRTKEAPCSSYVSTPLAQNTTARRNVLVVEDNVFNWRVAARFLERLGHTATFAENGEAAVRLAVKGGFDLVLMDMHMPVMDGLEATRRIRASGERVPVVALTANASETDRERCAAVGMNGFETKPIPMDRLRALVERWCDAQNATLSTNPDLGSKPLAVVSGVSPLDMDHERVADLVAALGEDGLAELREEFKKDARSLLAELSAALGTGDAMVTDRVFHTIKGAASNVGYRGIAELAEAARHKEDKAGREPLETELRRLLAGDPEGELAA